MVFILVAKISSIKVCEKLETNSILEQVLLRLLQLVGTTSDSKVVSMQIINKQIKTRLLTFELSNINSKFSENCNIFTKRIYDSAVFKVLLNIITICVFIAQ